MDDIGHALSLDEIMTIVHRPIEFYRFSEIKQFKNILDLFDMRMGVGSILILYRQAEYFGHWCAMNCVEMIMPEGNKYVISYMDSYGREIDSSPKFVTEKTRKKVKETRPFIVDLINNNQRDDIEFHYNDIKLQKGEKGINTCGRYCALFMKYPYMNVTKFAKILKSSGDPDKAVVEITNYLYNQAMN